MKMPSIARRIAGRIAEAIDDPMPAALLAPANRGPNIAPSITDGSWTGGLAGIAVQDGTGLHFNGTDAGSLVHTLDTEDNVTYEITWTQTVGASGSFRWQLYGDTNAHLGQTASFTTSGTFVIQVTTNAAGSFNNRIQANVNAGTAGSNFVTISYLEIRKVLP